MYDKYAYDRVGELIRLENELAQTRAISLGGSMDEQDIRYYESQIERLYSSLSSREREEYRRRS